MTTITHDFLYGSDPQLRYDVSTWIYRLFVVLQSIYTVNYHRHIFSNVFIMNIFGLVCWILQSQHILRNFGVSNNIEFLHGSWSSLLIYKLKKIIENSVGSIYVPDAQTLCNFNIENLMNNSIEWRTVNQRKALITGICSYINNVNKYIPLRMERSLEYSKLFHLGTYYIHI